MTHEHQHYHAALQALDDRSINPSAAADLDSVVSRSRRQVLKGGLAMAALGLFGGSLAACRGGAEPVLASPLMGFAGVPAQTSATFDDLIVPDGYTASPFFRWGDAVLDDAPAWLEDASQDWQAQLLQAGDNHDGMHFFPFDDAPNDHGLLVVNHEYINPTLHPDGQTFTELANGSRQRPMD